MWTRRQVLGLAAAACTAGCGQQSAAVRGAPVAPTGQRADPFAELERRLGGRVGAFVFDTATGTSREHRADERFAMCSTFKWALAAAVLARADRGELVLSEPVAFSRDDLLAYAPETRAHVADGQMTIEALAQAAVEVSDNTAANLLLARVGGPAGLTQFFRSLGDTTTRLDRNEPTLNANLPNDERDTTSPRSMGRMLSGVIGGNVLSDSSRGKLVGWLVGCKTGAERLRAGLPAGWKAGDKTGTGERGACNDVAVVWPPGGAPRIAAIYLSDSQAPLAALNAAHAEIGRMIARWEPSQR